MTRTRWQIVISDVAEGDLAKLRVFDRRRVDEAIERELAYEPFVRTKNKKPLRQPHPRVASGSSAWELKVDPFRAFYAVDEAGAVRVLVLAVRHKGRRTTGEIL